MQRGARNGSLREQRPPGLARRAPTKQHSPIMRYAAVKSQRQQLKLSIRIGMGVFPSFGAGQEKYRRIG